MKMKTLRTASTVVLFICTAAVGSHAQTASSPVPTIHILKDTLTISGGCETFGMETGDPAKTASIAVEKFAPGCAIPWHWHTPNEHVLMVSGTINFEIKGEKSVQIHSGDFVKIPSHRVSQTTCVGPESCVSFLYTDAPIDIHFVDDAGVEISNDKALEHYKIMHPTGR
jgi:quercetin dioxygenase-like cupin family protein